MIVDKAAFAVRNSVELPDGRQAEMREVVTEFLEVFLAQHLLIPPIWAPRHAENSTVFSFCSPQG